MMKTPAQDERYSISTSAVALYKLHSKLKEWRDTVSHETLDVSPFGSNLIAFDAERSPG